MGGQAVNGEKVLGQIWVEGEFKYIDHGIPGRYTDEYGRRRDID